MMKVLIGLLRKTVFALMCLLFLTINGFAQIDAEKETLKGITKIAVIVNSFEKDDEIKSLISQMERDTEIRLRKAGISLVNGTKAAKGEDDSQNAVLEIKAQIGALEKPFEGLYIYSIDLEIDQDIRLIRNSNITRRFVPTYKVSGEIGIIGRSKLSNLRDKVSDLVDTFINDYLTVNPK